MSADNGVLVFSIDAFEADRRLDQVVADHLVDGSRSFAARLIKQGHVLVDGNLKKPAYRIRPGDQITADIPPPLKIDLKPEAIPLDIIFEDAHIILVNKQAGLVVHPSPGHLSGTLVNGLLYHCPDLGGIAGMLRPGIVHRLDKDTSGVMVAAKTDAAHQNLSAQFKDRTVSKTYLGIVYGEPAEKNGRITLPIGRHPVHRKKMSTRSTSARPAETDWKVIKKNNGLSLVEFELKTGRTHQIRVHITAMGHPLVGDPVYSRRKAANRLPNQTAEQVKAVTRQMLHAHILELTHPQTGQQMIFKAPLPDDMTTLLKATGLISGPTQEAVRHICLT